MLLIMYTVGDIYIPQQEIIFRDTFNDWTHAEPPGHQGIQNLLTCYDLLGNDCKQRDMLDVQSHT